MENLQGGTLALEHRYTIESSRRQVGFISRYEATQAPFEVPVWVDVFDILSDVRDPDLIIERLEESAQRTANLSGEGILSLLDYGELDPETPFIVSDRVVGPTLEERLDDNPLTLDTAVPLVRRLARILTRAHDQDIMHGRLAPRWISLPEGRLDDAAIGHFEIGPTLGELRRMDDVVLTPEMVDAFPPEAFERPTQPPDLEDEEFDATREFTVAADTYALGLVAYISMVGHHPFFDEASTDASDGIARIQHEPPRPPAEFGVSEEASDCMLKALADDPEERYETPMAFADALERTAGVGSGADGSVAAPESKFDEAESTVPPDASAEAAGRSEDYHEQAPGPASTAMTLAVALLMLTNLVWFLFWYLGSPPGGTVNLRLDSNPSKATVQRTDETGETLGRTPLSIQRSAEAPSSVDLYVSKTGFESEVITIGANDKTHDIAVRLTPESTTSANSETDSGGSPSKQDRPSDAGNPPDSEFQ